MNEHNAESDVWPTWCPDCQHHADVHHDECTVETCGCDRSRDEFATRVTPPGGPMPDVESGADLNEIARAICDSEAFMWLMVGSNHTESQLASLRETWREHYLPAGGGYGARARRVTPPGSGRP